MSSVHKDRLTQLAQVCRLWQRLPAEQQARDWTYEEAAATRQEVLRKLVELCEPEVREAVLQDLAGAELCGLYIVPSNEGQEAFEQCKALIRSAEFSRHMNALRGGY